MNITSILMKESIEPFLKTARANLEHDGILVPVLMVDVATASPLLILLRDVPNTTELRQVYFAKIGIYLRAQGQSIRAAVSLAESWIVLGPNTPAALGMQPSQHPSRQEALALVGRNVENTRTTQVIQPFTRTATNQPVWSEPAIALYNKPVAAGHRPVGLLDDLFLGNQAR